MNQNIATGIIQAQLHYQQLPETKLVNTIFIFLSLVLNTLSKYTAGILEAGICIFLIKSGGVASVYPLLSNSPFGKKKQLTHFYLCRRHGSLARYVKLWVAHAPGMPGTFSPPLRISDPDMHHGTCMTHVPWCMPGSLTSGFLWLSLRRLVSWIDHLPPACWSTVWKSISKQQLGCRCDIMDSIFYFLYFDICNYICLDTPYHFLALSFLLKYSLFFQLLLY